MRPAGLVLVAVLTVATGVTPAFAHGTLISANPTPNIGYGRAPTKVELRFSEPIKVPPSTVQVLDRGGSNVARDVRAAPADPQSLRAALPNLPPGIYRLEWRAVSRVDGHTTRGSYVFGVQETPPGEGPVSEAGPLGGSVHALAFRVVQDAALLLFAGMLAILFVAGGAVPRFAGFVGRAAPRVALVAAGGAIATVASEAVAAAGWSAPGLAAFLTGSVPGWGRTATAVLAAGAWAAARGRRSREALGLAVGSLAAIGISGHAGAAPHAIGSMAANAAHLASIAVWLGGAAAIAIGWRSLRLERHEIVALIGRASPVAIASALVVAATGSVNAYHQLTSIQDLWRTGYGRIVLAKIAVLLAAAALGVRHSLVLRRRLAAAPSNPGGTERTMLRAVSGERWAGAVAVVLAALLVAVPNPPAQEARAERQENTVPAIYALGEGPFVTVADRSGSLLVALAISPPRPGGVRVGVQLVGSGDLSTEGWRVVLDAAGPRGESVRRRLAPCGPGCFTAAARLASRGVWSFRVDAQGRTVSFRIPLPTPSGAAVLRRLREAYGRLRSLRLDETFTGGPRFSIRTVYRFEAPDRTSLRSSTGREEIQIGRSDFTRDAPDMPWRKDELSAGIRIPFIFPWQRAGRPMLLGRTTIAGRPAFLLSLFDPIGIWYRIAVDERTGRPLRESMRAPGHFMERVYSRFDEPMNIRAPRGGS